MLLQKSDRMPSRTPIPSVREIGRSKCVGVTIAIIALPIGRYFTSIDVKISGCRYVYLSPTHKKPIFQFDRVSTRDRYKYLV